MGSFQEMSDGKFLLTAQVGVVTIKEVFEKSQLTPEEISNIPKSDGFYLYIKDILSSDDA